MATTPFTLQAVLGLDSSAYDRGLENARSAGARFGSGLMTAANIGLQAVTAATTAVVGMGAASVRTGMDFDQSMSQVAATMGTTVDQIQDLRNFALEMGRTTAFSATEAAGALNYMALAGYDVTQSMEMLPNVLNLAAAGTMDLQRASDMLTDASTAFGLSVEEDGDRIVQMVDEMAKAASTGNTSVEQLGDAFLTVGGLAQELNGGLITLEDGTTATVDGIQELEIALTAMANAGIKGGEAGTHMRNMLLKLASPTSDGTKALEAMGVAVFDAEGNMRSLSDIFGELNESLGTMTQEEKIQAISDLFNTRDLASAEAMLNAVGQDWDAIGESILNADGAAQQMADTQLDNLAGDITLFKSALEGAKIAISDILTGGSKDEGLRAFVNFGTEGIQKLTEAFQNGGLEGAMEVFGQVLSDGLGMIINKLPTLVDAGMKMLGAIGQGLLDNLPVIIDAAIKIIDQLMQGLISALPSLIQGAIELVRGLAQGLVQAIPMLVDVLITALPQIIDGLIQITMDVLNALAEMLPTLIPQLVQGFIDALNAFLSNVDLMVETAVNLIMGLTMGIINALPILIEALPQILEAIVNAIVDNLPLIIDAGIQLIGALVEAILTNLPQLIVAGIQMLVSLIGGILNALPELLVTGAKLVIELATAILKSLPELIAGGVKIIGAIVEGIVNTIGNVIEAIIGMIKAIIDTIGDFIGGVFEAGVDIVTNIMDGIDSLGKNAAQWGKDLIDNFIGGIKDKISAVVDTCKDIAGTIAEYLGFSEPEKGPLSNFHTYAPDMIDLFTSGLEAGKSQLEETLNDVLSVPEINAEGNMKIESASSNFESQVIVLLQSILDKEGVELALDADKMFDVMRVKNSDYYKSTGTSAFA